MMASIAFRPQRVRERVPRPDRHLRGPPLVAVAATVGVIVAAIYLLWAYQQVFHGQPTEEDTKTRDLGWSERLIVAR